jgi:hypothetical protein
MWNPFPRAILTVMGSTNVFWFSTLSELEGRTGADLLRGDFIRASFMLLWLK